MIKTIEITNYKSIENLTIELGQVTVLIGENGSGKSNILEAIALASAAANDKLGNEFLIPRGIRMTEPQLMRAGFDSNNSSKDIEIILHLTNTVRKRYIIRNDNKSYFEWLHSEELNDSLVNNIQQVHLSKVMESIERQEPTTNINSKKIYQFLKHNSLKRKGRAKGKSRTSIDSLPINMSPEEIKQLSDEMTVTIRKTKYQFGFQFNEFLIYAPENTALRNFHEEGQIQPLGVKGEGLFKLLSVMSREPKKGHFAEVKTQLQLFDWFDDFDMPNNLFPGERRLQIKDRYLDETIAYFDQRSANEGFLYLLFYFTLFISDYTPQFFAIDNIDASLNPKLCQRLMQELVILAKKHGKQVIMTTHNPAILDGLDLSDEAQKLHVVYRNLMGQTKVRPVSPAQPVADEEPIRLSEAFLKGYLGGLPENF